MTMSNVYLGTGGDSAPLVILYAEIGSKGSNEVHSKMEEEASKGEIR